MVGSWYESRTRGVEGVRWAQWREMERHGQGIKTTKMGLGTQDLGGQFRTVKGTERLGPMTVVNSGRDKGLGVISSSQNCY